MTDPPESLGESAFEHVVNLVGLGPRAAGTRGEAKAIEYVREHFQSLGLHTEVEPFTYESFEFTEIDLVIGGISMTPTLIAFDPYSGPFKYAGTAKMVDPAPGDGAGQHTALKDAVVVTSAPADYFQLAIQQPKLVIYVDPADYATLRTQQETSFSLTIQGKRTQHESANVTGRITPPAAIGAEIILSAHLDAYADSPGADDNASGVGVLIELARHLKAREGEIACSLGFVAFGAEEVGILGSRVYVEKHARELEQLALALNLDQVGGNERPSIEMRGGVTGLPARKGESQFPARFQNRALDGQENNWRMIVTPDLLAPMAASNHPQWLIEMLQASAQELGIEVTSAGNLGSDQQAFTQAGIVATGIGIGGNRVHCLQDTLDQVQITSLQKGSALAARITAKTMQKLAER